MIAKTQNGEEIMPGATIGTKFNAVPEVVWENNVVVSKVDGQYIVGSLPTKPTHPEVERVDAVIRNHLNMAVVQLNGES